MDSRGQRHGVAGIGRCDLEGRHLWGQGVMEIHWGEAGWCCQGRHVSVVNTEGRV